VAVVGEMAIRMSFASRGSKRRECYCGRDGHKDEFCFKRKREERMAKEWANKDKYHPSNGVLEPCVQLPRAKASVRIVPAWGE
jgi:hypothetical protein